MGEQRQAASATEYDGSGNDVEVAIYLQYLRCWRCWKFFEVPTRTGDQETGFLYYCNRCGSERGVNGNDYQNCFWRYVKKLRGDGKPVVPISQRLYYQFDREFQKNWFLKCSCGGGFKAYFIRPISRCSHCGAGNIGWLPWPRDEEFTFHKVPALIYGIHPAYQQYDTSVPTWLLDKSQALQTGREQKKERKFVWMLRLFIFLPLGLIVCIYGLLLVGVNRIFGFLTGTYKQKLRKHQK